MNPRNVNRTPEATANRRRAQLERLLPERACRVCGQVFRQKAGNQYRCPDCIEADPYNQRSRRTP